jgi:Periplasmic sensor domain
MKMGARYRNLPIRQKLRLIIMATVAAALILACAAFLVYDQIALRNSLLASTAVTAEMIGSNSTGALSFGDQKAATELLRTLRAQRSLVAAALYSANGQLFAVYLRDGAQQHTPFPRLRADGSWFEDDRLKLFRRVVLAQQAIGAVYLESDLVEIHTRLKTFLGTTMIVLLATVLAGICALFLASGQHLGAHCGPRPDSPSRFLREKLRRARREAVRGRDGAAGR